MKTYTFTVSERLSRDVEIEANSYEEALEKVEDMYNREEIVLTENDLDGMGAEFDLSDSEEEE